MAGLQLLKRNSAWALSMRLRHLAVTTAESRTILVQVRTAAQHSSCMALVVQAGGTLCCQN